MFCDKGFITDYRVICDSITHVCKNELICREFTTAHYIGNIVATSIILFISLFLMFILCILMDFGTNIHGGVRNTYYMKLYIFISIIAIIVTVMDIYQML